MDQTTPKQSPEGWGWPLASHKAHYFVGIESLCKRWWYSGELETGQDEHSANCAECKRQKTRRNTQRQEHPQS